MGGNGAVLVVGSLNMDSFRYVEALPEPGETVTATDFVEGVGGKGCNQAAMAGLAARKLAPEAVQVAMLGCVGGDAQGKVLVDTLASNGVDTAAIIKRGDDVRSGSAAITVDEKGENTIVIHPGANHTFGPEDLDALGQDLWARTAVVLCQNEIPIAVTTKALQQASQAGKLALLNFAPAPRAKVSREVFEACSVLLVNETEAITTLRVHLGVEDVSPAASDVAESERKSALQDIAQQLASSLDGKVAVVLTAGALGAVVVSDQEATWVTTREKVSKSKVVDTTGAGDCFAGVFAVETARHCAITAENTLAHSSLCEAATLACTAAATSIQRRGCVASYEFASEVLSSVSNK